jgi:hypothetical protein
MELPIDRHLGSNCRDSLAGKVLHVPILRHAISSLPDIGRRRHVTTLLLSCLMVWSLQTDLAAQQSTSSHRLLGNGLPNLSGGASQMELFRRLQLLSGAAQAKGDDLSKSLNSDSDAMRSLQEAMQSLQRLQGGQPGESPQDRQNGSRPNGNSPTARDTLGPRQDPVGSAPGKGSPGRGTSRPQFGQSEPAGQPPGTQSRGTQHQPGQRPGQGLREPGLPDSEVGPRLNNGARPGGTRPGDGRTGRSATDPARSVDGTPAGGETTTPYPRGSSSEPRTSKAAEPPKGFMQSLLDRLTGRDPAKSNRGQPTESVRPVPGSSQSGGTIDSREPSGIGAGRSTPGSRGSGDDAGTGRGPKSNDPSAAGNDWFPEGGIAPPRKTAGRSPSGPAQITKDTLRGVSPDEITELMRSQAGQTARDSPRAGGSGGTSDGGDAPSAVPGPSMVDRLKAQRKAQLDDLRDSSKTLKQKLLDIANLARSESNREESVDGPADSAAADGLQSAFVNALQEATKGLAEHVEEFAARDRFNRAQSGRSRPPQGQEQERGSFDQLGRMGDRANGWFTDLVEPATPPASTATSAFNGSDAVNFSVSFELLLALGIIVVGSVFWMQQRRRAGVMLQSMTSSQTAAPASLNNRQDIVQAFHDLAARCPAVVADWWTHDRAAEALATSKPEVDAEVRQLAQLYEQARYLPDESSLTDEQLAAAKAAWLRCRKS